MATRESYSLEILEKIRALIIKNFAAINIEVGTHYKIAQPKDTSAEFKIEIMQTDLPLQAMRGILKANFIYNPTIIITGGFGVINCMKEYDFYFKNKKPVR